MVYSIWEMTPKNMEYGGGSQSWGLWCCLLLHSCSVLDPEASKAATKYFNCHGDEPHGSSSFLPNPWVWDQLEQRPLSSFLHPGSLLKM